MNDFDAWLLHLSRSLRASGECTYSSTSRGSGGTVFSMAATKRASGLSHKMPTSTSSTSTDLPAEYRLTPGRHSTGWPQTFWRETTSDSPSLTRPAPIAVQPRDDTERLDRLSELVPTCGFLRARRPRMDPWMVTDLLNSLEQPTENPSSPTKAE